MREKGFTLVELLILTAIISILAALGIAQFAEYTKRGHDRQAITMARDMLTASAKYYTDNIDAESDADRIRSDVNDMYEDTYNSNCNETHTATLCQHNNIHIVRYDGDTDFVNSGVAFKVYHSSGSNTYCVSPDVNVLEVSGTNSTCP